MPNNPTNTITPYINRLRPRLITLARRELKDKSLDPQDIVGDAILTALTEQQNRTDLHFPNEQAAYAWLSQIVRNKCRATSQAERLRRTREAQAAERQDWEYTEDFLKSFRTDQESKMLYEIIDRSQTITAHERRILLHRIETDASWREIAEHFGLSEVNCRVIFHRALTALKATWESMQHAAPDVEM